VNNKKKIVFNDFVVKPEICNFSCDYCLSNEAPKWIDMNNKSDALCYGKTTELGKKLDSVIERIDNAIDASILRISGGELFALKNITDFLLERTNYETIQVITNGYFLTENILSELKKIPNCNIHISLDGHDLRLNGLRVKKESVQQRLLNNLNCAVEMGFHVEIGSVLSTANTAYFDEFLDYLMKYENKVTVYPFPVRGSITSKFFPSKDAVESFSLILENYDKYKGVLAHKSFIEQCVFLLEGKKKKLRCHIPALSIQSFDNGNITSCPNSWSSMIGNVNEISKEEMWERMQNDRMAKLFLQPSPKIPFCKQCYTSLDILNLYIEGFISDDEMVAIPLYSSDETMKRIKEYKIFINNRG